VSRFSHAVRFTLAVAVIGTAGAATALSAPQEPPGGSSAATMKTYSQVIPGTEIKFDLVPIPGGTFEMGAPSGEAKHGKDEEPQHTVQIEPFWMGSKEVTWDEYEQFAFSYDLKKKKREGVDLKKQSELEKKADAVTRPTPPYADSTFGHGRSGQPAICITHHAAMEYCRWLSEKTGLIYRLPTEAEWEFACRAGTKTAYFWGDEMPENNEYAWFVNNSEKPMPVGKKKPSPWGLYDIHGNVAEWCLDHYDPAAYKKFAAVKPCKQPVVLPDAKEYPYVARGGSWDDDADVLRSAARVASNPEWSVQDPQRPQSIWWHTDATKVGFRIIRPLKEQDNLKGLKSQVVKGKTTR
jgi:formylglycine-generating enzyme required for sulfatase activity